MNDGISSLQGPHHVAQKFRTMTLPLKSARRTSAPFMSFTVNARFALPDLAGQAAVVPGSAAGSVFPVSGMPRSIGSAKSAMATVAAAATIHRARLGEDGGWGGATSGGDGGTLVSSVM